MPARIDSGSVTYTKKIFSAIFFIGSTFQLVFVSQAIITLRYVYPPYQTFGLSQLVILVLALSIGRCFNVVKFPGLDRRIARRIIPLIILNCGCAATSLEYFNVTSISVFNIPYRLGLLITVTMVLEYLVFDVEINNLVKFPIAAIIAGAIISGSGDDISMSGHFVILLNYIFSAGTRVYYKMILDSRELGVSGLIYYSTIIVLSPTLVIDLLVNGMSQYLDNLQFWWHHLITSVMSAIFSWSAIMCIKYNGALTTTVFASLTNTFITDLTFFDSVKDNDVLSMFSWQYYVGCGFLLLGSLVYLIITFRPNSYFNGALISTCQEAV